MSIEGTARVRSDMKYFLIAGEASGDMHAARLMGALKREDTQAEFRYYGGDAMHAQAPKGMVAHYRGLAIMGFFEVLTRLRTVRRRFQEVLESIANFAPDVLILVDFGGFNLRVAKKAKALGFKVFYYIVPKVWAWNARRVEQLRRYTDEIFVIFPFEVPYFQQRGLRPHYVGNPSVDTIEEGAEDDAQLAKRVCGDDARPVIALLPGSRAMEIRYNLPRMARVAEFFPKYHFVLCAADSVDDALLQRYMPKDAAITIARGTTRAVLRVAAGAVVTSGTATLEAALLRTPEVVVYRAAWPTMIVAWMLIRVRWISLVNLVLGRECVRELKQHKYTVGALERELRAVLPGGERRAKQQSDYEELRQKLGAPGVADRLGNLMVKLLREAKRG